MYKKKINDLRREIILETRMYMIKKNIESIRFDHPFKINVEVRIHDDYQMVPLICEQMDLYGNLTTLGPDSEPYELTLEELDIYDTAHIHEQVTRDNYKIEQYISEMEPLT